MRNAIDVITISTISDHKAAESAAVVLPAAMATGHRATRIRELVCVKTTSKGSNVRGIVISTR